MRKHLGFIAVVATMIGAAFAAPASAHELGSSGTELAATRFAADCDQPGERALATYREGELRERRERERERGRFLRNERGRERRERFERRGRFERGWR
jgi:hypothetical protein